MSDIELEIHDLTETGRAKVIDLYRRACPERADEIRPDTVNWPSPVIIGELIEDIAIDFEEAGDGGS